MSQATNDLKPSTPTPSTPPMFGISSPDFKNFKSWVRTSPFTNDFELSKDKFQLSDMDFEAAYAMFTAETPPQVLNPPSNPHTPITNYQHEISNHLNELHNQKETGPKINSPVLANLLQSFSPQLPTTEGENIALFQNYDELLSVNESNAIEQFLDSIMDEQNAQKNPKNQLPQSLKPDPLPFDDPKNDGIDPVRQEISPKTENSQIYTNKISVKLNNTKNVVNVPKDPNVFPEELNISKEAPNVSKRSASVSSEEQKQAKKRRLLTEEEKKYKHTSSEQRRRSVIKDAFDNLLRLLPSVNKTKKQPKSVVLDNAANEIERLISINNELKQLLMNQESS